MKMSKFVKKTRKAEKVNKTRTITPALEPVADLVCVDVSKDTPRDALELCTAADALDEFLKREMATRMAETLRKRTAEALRATEEAKRLEDERQSRKRKREEEDEGRKKARNDELAKLNAQWEDDDEGLTEEEKEEFAKERSEKLTGMEGDQKKEDDGIAVKRKDEDESFEKGPGGKDEVKAVVPAQYDAFGFFDRVPGFASVSGSLPRLRMENVLLCTDEDLTLDELGELMKPALDKGEKGGMVAYESLTVEALPADAAKAATAAAAEGK